uniref:rutC family protein HP_0944-like isoform X2 n=1 Tax=Styela clava TaxID=7725 RepID=UPI00193931D9|nr:rutC family protein HP_0944-like isoform X2 [Styela clava]
MSSDGNQSIRKEIRTKGSSTPIGPYSQAVKVGPTLYVSGNIGVVPATGEFAGADIESQTQQVMENMKNVLEEAGMTFKNVVKTTVLLKDIEDFASANAVYAKYFTPPYPARAAYEVANLPKYAKIEIEAIAVDCEDSKL